MNNRVRSGFVMLGAVLSGSVMTAQQQSDVRPAGTEGQNAGAILRPVESTPSKQDKVKAKKRFHVQAWMGIETRPPTPGEIKLFGLETRVRVIGRLVSKLVADGPAAKVGIRKGDVLLKLDDMDIYSHDDIADFMAVSKPKQDVKLLILRGNKKKRKSIKLRLGSNKVKVPTGPRMRWQYASLAQLDKALATAKKQGRRLLIGLTGAET